MGSNNFIFTGSALKIMTKACLISVLIFFGFGCQNFDSKPKTDVKIKNIATSPEWFSKITPLENIDFVITPEEDHTKLLNAFKSAKSTIKVGIFGISSKPIADELQAAVIRGIKVTVICDNYCISSPKRLALFDQLKAAGADIVLATPGFAISHWKMFIIDDETAFISTMNFISRSNQMRDFGIFTTEKSVVAEILNVYNQDLLNAKNKTAITPKLTSNHLVWSPINSETKLIELINSAQFTIEIWIENMGNRNIHLALKKAAERNVQVRVLTSVCGLGMNAETAYKNLNELISFGIKVQGMPYPATTDIPYIHAKSIHVDHSILFMGSENFSWSSLLKSRELGIIFKDFNIEKKLSEYYEKDWSKSVAIPTAAPESCESMTPVIDSLID